MSDFCDDASKTSELYLSIALANRHSDGPTPKGFCYNCREPLDEGLRFCDIDCRDDWVILSKRKRT
jgi:hypothetical protein